MFVYLKVFLHVSTLYVGSSKVMDEKHYNVIDDPHEIIRNRGNYAKVLSKE